MPSGLWITGGLLLAALAAAWFAWPRGPAAPQDRPLDLPLAPLDPGGDALEIVAFGTSLTAGNPWPAALEADLAACLGRPVRITRVARHAEGSAWGLTRTGEVIAAAPDLVLIEFAVNDADLFDGVSLATSRAQHEDILRRLRAALPEAGLMLMTMSPITGIARHLQRPRLAAYDALYRDLAAAHGVGLADLAPRWRRAWADGLARPADGLHPDGAATARVTVPALLELLTGPAGCVSSG